MEKELPPNAAGQAHFNLLRAWCKALDQDWDSVIKKAGVSDTGRTMKNRMVRGEVSLGTAVKIGTLLKSIQDKTGRVASVGPQALLLREWSELGGRLALADPEAFADIFERVRKIVDGAEAKAAGAFTRAAK